MESLVNNLDLFWAMRTELDSLSDKNKLFELLKEKLGLDLNEERSEKLHLFCKSFCSRLVLKWKKSNRTLQRFLHQNQDWLDSPIVWPDVIVISRSNEEVGEFLENIDPVCNVQKEDIQPSTSEASTSTYAPRKPFEELGDRQKRRRMDHSIDKSLSPEELGATAVRNLRHKGELKVSKILDHLLQHPEDVVKVEACLKEKKSEACTPDKALGLLVSLKLSKWQYINLRDSASEQGCDIYPSYYRIKKAKLDCYPSKEDISISEDGAQIKLQALLDITVQRLINAHNIKVDSTTELKLTSKWGFDGASGQSTYKQTGEVDDSSIFMASLVPLVLENEENIIIWENDRPSSTFYCRPISFRYIKETREVVTSEMSRIKEEITALRPTKIEEASISHNLLLTMIEGKITSIISETSSATCDICSAKPSEMNDLEAIRRKSKNEDIYQYGLSSLHAWIRCMECLLHIAYRLDFKKWSARGEDKILMAQKKEAIQREFKETCGLHIDIVKQGAGTTNDGNTARRFFRDFKTSARITGLSKDLIERFYVILQTIASGERVDVSKFSQFCQETADFYVELYPWYYMPSSVHKLLMHGADIIEHFGMLPIGKLSEEASEARNKDFRNFRESHSRKNSRVATNEDIFHNLLLTSDPKLAIIRPRMGAKTRMSLSPKSIELLVPLLNETCETEFINVSNFVDSDSE